MREAELSQFYLDQMLELLTTPLGMAGLLVLLALVGSAVVVPAMRWAFLAGLIYMATVPLTEAANVNYVPLAAPLNQLRTFGRPLIYMFLGLLLIPLLLSQRGWRVRLVTAPLILFFCFELIVSFRLMAFGNVFRGMLSVASYGLILLTLGLAVSRWLQTMEDLYKLLWCVCLVGSLVTLATVYQLAVNRALIITNSRLVGVTGNPQFLGIIIAYTLPVACHLLTRPSGSKLVKPLLIAQVTVMIVMLVWTGSRMGVLSTGLAVFVLFHRRLGRFVILGAILAITVYLALPYFEGSSKIADRLIWSKNTRADVWAYMYLRFTEAPIFGVSRQTFETAENSFLAMLSQFGIVCSLPVFIAMGVLAWQLFGLHRLRGRLGPERGLVDLILGLWTAVLVTSIFEGLLMGVITFPVMAIYVFAAATTFLKEWAEADQTHAQPTAEEYADPAWRPGGTLAYQPA